MFGIKKNNTRDGFTLVEALVGTALMVVVFMGVFAAYNLGLKVIGLSKNRITATAIANSRIETARNLSYELVGTLGAVLPEASGSLEKNTTQAMNNGVYSTETKVIYVADPADGTGTGDNCDLDYKKVEVSVSWSGVFPGQVIVSTDIAPKNTVQEIQSCMTQPGGVLEVTVFDGAGIAVPSPLITVYDPETGNVVASVTPAIGKYSFPLVLGSYRVEVSKLGYSSARTYSTNEVAVPDSLNPSVLNGELTSMSLSIDYSASISVDGVSPTGQDSFADSFADQSLISQMNGIEVNSGSVQLSGTPYSLSGSLVSDVIAPVDLVSWDNLVFDDSHPISTSAVYQLLYFDGVDWILIPDIDLTGNSVGFTTSPVSLAGLDKNDYPQIKVRGILSTTDGTVTPTIHSWQVLWTNSVGMGVANVNFHMQGEKTIGTDGAGDKVYKYSQDHALDGSGHINLDNIEADAYSFTVDPTSGLSLIGTDKDPQPVNVGAVATVPIKLFLRAQNALMITVQNDVTIVPVFSAAIRLYSPSLGYDKTQNTNVNGQTYFAPLQNGSYNLEIVSSGYDSYSGTVLVAGETSNVINIHQQE